jgi:hypothetical protein
MGTIELFQCDLCLEVEDPKAKNRTTHSGNIRFFYRSGFQCREKHFCDKCGQMLSGAIEEVFRRIINKRKT